MSTEGRVRSLRDALVAELDKTNRWLCDAEALERSASTPEVGRYQLARSKMETLARRGSATLLTVAVIGEFSSGKSFLLSGIQRHLKDQPVRNEGRLQHRYVGVLPSTPTPTTSCPARLVSYVAGTELDEPILNVRFVGSPDWHARPVDPARRTITAYATELPGWLEFRLPEDQGREVAEVEVMIRDAAIPAEFYDLPGGNSPSLVHEQIIESHLQDADCFIYVTKATSTLRDSDLRQIRTLYAHYQVTQKPILWVVTGIDQAEDIGLDGRPGWQTTIDRNNQYIREYFPDSRSTFLGEGFIGVSPALEAQGEYLAYSDPEQGAHLLAASRMQKLRDSLNSLIEGYSGQSHMAQLRSEARSIVKAVQDRLVDWLAIERLPLSELGASQASIEKEIESLDLGERTMMAELKNRTMEHSAELERQLEKKMLFKLLHQEIDPLIDQLNPLRETDQNMLELAIQKTIREWLSEAEGPYKKWAVSFGTDAAWAATKLSSILASVSTHGGLREQPAVPVEDYSVTLRPLRSDAIGDGSLATTINIASQVLPMSGAALAAAGLVTGTVLLAPVGIALAVGGIFALARRRGQRQSTVTLLRGSQKDNLDFIAAEVKKWLIDQVESLNTAFMAEAAGKVAVERSALVSSLERLRRRQTDSEFVKHAERVEQLTSLTAQGEKLLASL